MPWKTMLLLVVLAAGSTGFGQTPGTSSRIPVGVWINGQLTNAAIVVSEAGSVQAYYCPAPQQYATSDGKQGWACFEPATGVWLLGALPPPTIASAPPVVSARPPAAPATPAAPPAEPEDNSGSAGIQDPETEAPPRVIYVEAPPRVVYVEAPPQIIYVQPPPPPVPEPEIIYVPTPPAIIVVEQPVGRRGGRDRDEEIVAPPSGFSVAPVYTNQPTYTSRPVYANPSVGSVPADDRGRRDGGRDGRDEGRRDGSGPGDGNNNGGRDNPGARGR